MEQIHEKRQRTQQTELKYSLCWISQGFFFCSRALASLTNAWLQHRGVKYQAALKQAGKKGVGGKQG